MLARGGEGVRVPKVSGGRCCHRGEVTDSLDVILLKTYRIRDSTGEIIVVNGACRP